MSKPTAKDLAALITGLTKTRSQFAVSGTMPEIAPQITIEGQGRIAWPLKPKAVKGLKETAQIAPFGRGVQTLVDASVRNTFEIDASRFTVSDEWAAAVAAVAAQSAADLGLDGEQLEAHPYKLLIYDKGGFFLPHRDSEKLDRMVASLVVLLPTKFTGGELVVRHQGQSRSFDFSKSRYQNQAEYVAFYADCEHEVKKVRTGQRVCLTYNLVLKPREQPTAKPSFKNPLVGAIHHRVTEEPDEPLVFALAHQYTQLGLSQDLLKGEDRELVRVVADAATECGCVVHLAQVEMHDTYSAFDDEDDDYDGGYRSRRGRSSGGSYEIQELIEREFGGVEWADLSGGKQPWGCIPLDEDSIVCNLPLEKWAPTREEYEGYTGNAGNTLDRWYHRTAAVVWPRARQFSILADAGAHNVLPTFDEMTKKLAKAPPAQRPELLTDCTALAEGVLRNWPVRWAHHHSGEEGEGPLWRSFSAGLVRVNDPALNARFLAKLALHDELTPLDKFLPAVCDAHGWKRYLAPLTAFFKPRKEERYARRGEISARDAAWLLAVCEHPSSHPDRDEVVRGVCRAAADWYCEQAKAVRVGYYDTSKERHQVLSRLVSALLAAGLESEAGRVITAMRATTEVNALETVQVPALVAVVPWCRKRFEPLPAVVGEWLTAVREELATATATKPTPPTDWVRPNQFQCSCTHCGGMKTFLASPTIRTHEIKAAEQYRNHVLGVIRSNELDVTTALNQRTTPRTLILTKSTSDYERRLKRYGINCELLDTIRKLVS